MSSSKKSRDGSKKPSVFERLGSKPSSATEDYCKQWAHKGSCSYSNKCKFLDTHNSKNSKPVTLSGKDGKKRSTSKSPANRKDVSNKMKSTTKQKPRPADSGEWEKSLEHEDEMALERKLQMLQRELAKQEEQEHKGKLKKPVAKKRERSSSSSSTSSSSSSDSTSESSDSSSSSSGSSSSSSSSSSDSDGEVIEKKTASKKKSNQLSKRSHSTSSRNQGHKEKVKAKAKKIAKLSPGTKKKDSSTVLKKQSRMNSSPKHQRSSSMAKIQRDSPSYSMTRSRSPRAKDSELLSKDRRQKRSIESPVPEAKRKPSVTGIRRRVEDHSPTRGRSRERKLGSTTLSSSSYDARKIEKQRDRLLEPGGYLSRPRSPIPISGYREPYPVRDLSPTSLGYRDRPRTDAYDIRRPYSPQPVMSKLERKDDLYDSRSRRPISPEPVRRPISARPKDYHDYDREWSANVDQVKIPDWEHGDYRRRNRPLDDVGWTRSSAEMSWKKAYSPPPAGHTYPEQGHSSSRGSGWTDPSSKLSSSRSDEPKRDRERRAGDARRPREINRRVPEAPVKPVTPAPPVTRPEEPRSPALSETASNAPPKVDVTEEPRPASSAVDNEEDFSDFSDDVDEILNRDVNDEESTKGDEPAADEVEPERLKTPIETELKVNVESAVPASDSQPSPKVLSPVASAIETRSNDEDLLGGMDIEQISDEELEDDAKTAPMDALEVDWTSLACKREKKTENGVTGARQRWQGKAVLARLGLTSSKGEPSTETDVAIEKKPLFDYYSLFRRALSARMDLSFRRSLCNLPDRELLIEHFDDDSSLYKASVDLLLKDRVLAA